MIGERITARALADIETYDHTNEFFHAKIRRIAIRRDVRAHGVRPQTRPTVSFNRQQDIDSGSSGSLRYMDHQHGWLAAHPVGVTVA
jgi:hypothetical protein